MNNNIPEMIDMVFDLEGFMLPAAYPFELWKALLHLAPELADEKYVGILPLRSTQNKEGLLLSKRAKLALRLPKTIAERIAAGLRGSTIQLGTSSLLLGKFKPRVIEPYPTIHAQQVTGASDEVKFMEEVQAQLNDMGVVANLICGKRGLIGDDQQSLEGYSLVAHDLKPEASLRLQYAGLGEHRQFGCGIFIPYKVISGLSDD
jgi:CRISPR-associated protein Cas6